MVLPPSDGLAYFDDSLVKNVEPEPGGYDHSLYNADIWGAPKKGDVRELDDTQLSDLSSIISTTISATSDSDFSTE